jgi:hypothetical protein
VIIVSLCTIEYPTVVLSPSETDPASMRLPASTGAPRSVTAPSFFFIQLVQQFHASLDLFRRRLRHLLFRGGGSTVEYQELFHRQFLHRERLVNAQRRR